MWFLPNVQFVSFVRSQGMLQKSEEAKKAQIFYANKGNIRGEVQNNNALKGRVPMLPSRGFMSWSVVCQ